MWHPSVFGIFFEVFFMFFFQYKMRYFSGEQEKESTIPVRSVPRDHSLSSLGKPCDANRDPQDGLHTHDAFLL